MLFPDAPFVAMDRRGAVYAYAEEPTKGDDIWRYRTDVARIDRVIPILSWDDTEPVHIPTKIEELRKELGE